jgi:hypothetical protein
LRGWEEEDEEDGKIEDRKSKIEDAVQTQGLAAGKPPNAVQNLTVAVTYTRRRV